MVPCIWSFSDGFWDCALPRFLLDAATNHECVHFSGLSWHEGLQEEPVGVIVIPGRHSLSSYEKLNEAGKRFKKLVWFIIGDEEGVFQSSRLDHPNSIIWWAMPPFNPKQNVDRVTVNGWPLEALEIIVAERALMNADAYERTIVVPKTSPKRKRYDWCFLGQVTHSRRTDCLEATKAMSNGILLASPGFTQGVPRADYYRSLLWSRMALCPSGPCTPDSFRFAEALEAGCIPICDDRTQNPDYPRGYWTYTLGENLPFPIVSEWTELPDIMETWLKDWEHKAQVVQAWWQKKKLAWIDQMREDLTP